MAGSGAVLAASPPVGPAEPVPDVLDGPDDQRAEQAADLVACERDLAFGRWAAVVFGGGGHGEERAGQHGQSGPSVPGIPSADLVLIQAGQALATLEVLLPGPPAAGDPGEDCEGNVAG